MKQTAMPPSPFMNVTASHGNTNIITAVANIQGIIFSCNPPLKQLPICPFLYSHIITVVHIRNNKNEHTSWHFSVFPNKGCKKGMFSSDFKQNEENIPFLVHSSIANLLKKRRRFPVTLSGTRKSSPFLEFLL